MSARLIVNADDLGLAEFIDAGILRCAREGILTSATLLVTGPTAARGAAEASRAGLGIGVHLALCGGLPPACDPEEVPTLVVEGRLRRSWAGFAADLLGGRVDLDEVERELEEQVVRAQRLCAIDHVDGHQHLHVFPGVIERVRRVCGRHGITAMRIPAEPPLAGQGPARELKRALLSSVARGARGALAKEMRAPEQFHGIAAGGQMDERTLLSMLERVESGAHEIGCHPGEGEGVVRADPRWRSRWNDEAQALCSPRARKWVEQRGIELIRFGDL